MAEKKDYSYYQFIDIDGIHDVSDEHPQPVAPAKPKKKSPPKQMWRYRYSGSVKLWGKIAIDNFETYTMAVSDKKAVQNILFQAKKQLGLGSGAGGLTLTNNVTIDF